MTQTQSIDYKVYFYKAIRYWYILVIALILASLYSVWKIRYTPEQYSVSARILVKDEYSSWGQEYFLPGMELVSNRNRLVNEVGTIKSFPMMKRTVKSIPKFKVFFFRHGNVKVSQLYAYIPFSLELDSNSLNNVGKRIYFRIKDKNHYVLFSNPENEEESSVECTFNSWCEYKGVRFKLSLRNQGVDGLKGDFYSFTINNIDRLAQYYQNALGVNVEEKEGSILLLSLNGTEINKEIDFLNHFINVYIEQQLEEANQIASNTIKFVDRQIKNILDSLIIAERELERFKIQSNIKRLGIDEKKAIESIIELEKQKFEKQFMAHYYQQMIDYIKNNDDAKGIIVPSFVDRNNVLFELLQNLITTYKKKSQYEHSITKDNERYEELLKSIEISKGIIIENLKANIERVNEELKQINDQIAFYDDKLKSLPSAEKQFVNIQRNYKLNSDMYTFLLKKRAEAAIAKGSNISKIKVLDKASPLRVRFIGPIASKIFTFNIIIALIIGGGIIFLLEYFNNKIIDKQDILNITKIPIIGTIGHYHADGSNVVLEKPKSVISEAFRVIRTKIAFLLEGKKEHFTILITSSISGEGKTFFSLNLAGVYSLQDKKTIVIGADLRKPKIHKDIGVPNETGLSNYLAGNATKEEIIQKTPYKNIDIITSGIVPPNPAELLGTKKMQSCKRF